MIQAISTQSVGLVVKGVVFSALKYLFLGNGDYAVRVLRHLRTGVPPLLVMTFPPKPRGRGRKLMPSPVREAAEQLGIPFLERDRLERLDLNPLIRELEPSIVLVADYGRLVGQELLGMLPGRWLNLHPSLLPRWRGPAPIRRCLMAGDTETGVTLMVMNEHLDEGDVLEQVRVEVDLEDDYLSMSEKLAAAGAKAFHEATPLYLQGKLQPCPQVGEASYAPAVRKEESLLDWRNDALSLHHRVRALNPGPGTYTFFRGRRLKIIRTVPHLEEEGADIGELVTDGRKLSVGTGRGLLELLVLQPEGKRAMTAEEFLRGYRPLPGERLG
jgi:methionyl-tRNA formyltransferase